MWLIIYTSMSNCTLLPLELRVCFKQCLFIFLAGYSKSTVGASPWFPRVFVWLSLCLLWRGSTKLHPDAQLDSECFPTKHATTWPVHSQPEGRHANRDQPSSKDHDQLCQHDPASQLQKGSGLIPENKVACHLPFWTEEQPAGTKYIYCSTVRDILCRL